MVYESDVVNVVKMAEDNEDILRKGKTSRHSNTESACVSKIPICSLCEEEFDSESHRSKTLECGHTFCSACLIKRCKVGIEFVCNKCQLGYNFKMADIDNLPGHEEILRRNRITFRYGRQGDKDDVDGHKSKAGSGKERTKDEILAESMKVVKESDKAFVDLRRAKENEKERIRAHFADLRRAVDEQQQAFIEEIDHDYGLNDRLFHTIESVLRPKLRQMEDDYQKVKAKYGPNRCVDLSGDQGLIKSMKKTAETFKNYEKITETCHALHFKKDTSKVLQAVEGYGELSQPNSKMHENIFAWYARKKMDRREQNIHQALESGASTEEATSNCCVIATFISAYDSSIISICETHVSIYDNLLRPVTCFAHYTSKGRDIPYGVLVHPDNLLLVVYLNKLIIFNIKGKAMFTVHYNDSISQQMVIFDPDLDEIAVRDLRGGRNVVVMNSKGKKLSHPKISFSPSDDEEVVYVSVIRQSKRTIVHKLIEKPGNQNPVQQLYGCSNYRTEIKDLIEPFSKLGDDMKELNCYVMWNCFYFYAFGGSDPKLVITDIYNQPIGFIDTYVSDVAGVVITDDANLVLGDSQKNCITVFD